MIKRIAAAAIAAMFLTSASVAPGFAQTTQAPAAKPAAKPASEKKAEKKKASEAQMAQRQKMKDCAAKWKDHKKATGEKGRKAYNAFSKTCLSS
jgi:hypothetical protein